MVNFDEILARVSVRDILVDAGLQPNRNRMACPIHDGNNPTAFSFTDSTFICFSCGAKGGLLALVEYLHKCSRVEAIRHLCRLAGLPYEEPGKETGANKKSVLWRRPVRRDTLLANADYQEATERLETLKLQRLALDVALQIVRRNVKAGRIPLGEFYLKEQVYLYELEELDPIIVQMNHEVNSIKRRLSNDRHTTTHC